MKCSTPSTLARAGRELVGEAFFRYGEFVVKYPWCVAFASLVFAFVCASGVVRLETETDNDVLFIPADTWGWEKYTEVKENFGDPARSTGIYMEVAPGRNARSLPALREAFRMHQSILGIGGPDLDPYKAYCARLNASAPCYATNTFDYLSIATMEQLDARASDGSLLHALDMADSVRTLEDGRQCMRLIYTYTGRFAEDEEFRTWRRRWETAAYKMAMVFNSSEHASVACLTNALFQDETEKLTADEVPLMGFCIVIIVVLMCVVLGGRPLRRSRLLIGFVSVFSVVLSLFCAYGVCGFVGIRNTSTSILLVFILLGVGVDDMIVIVRSTDRVKAPTIGQRMPQGLKESGLAITLTSITSIVAFAVATQVQMAMIRYFCAMGVFAILFDWILQLTLFVGLFVYDDRRRDANRLDCLIWIKGAAHDTPQDVSTEELPSRVEAAMDRFSRLLTTPLGVVLSLASWVIVLSALIAQLPHVSTEFDLKSYYPRDSPVQTSLKVQEDFFPGAYSQLQIVVRHDAQRERFFHQAELDALDSCVASLVGLGDFISWPEGGRERVDWTYAFRYWRNATGASTAGMTYADELQAFFRSPRFSISLGTACTPFCVEPQQFQEHIVLDDSGLPRWSRVMLTIQWPVGGDSRKIERANAIKDIVENTAGRVLHAYPYEYQFMVAERDERILKDVLKSLAWTCTAVCATVVILLDFFVGIFIGVCIALVDLSILGALTAVGSHMNTLVFLNLSMVIGMCVDYIVHSAHVLLHEYQSGKSPKEAINSSLRTIGRCIFEGASSTMCGLMLPAFFGRSQAASNFGTTLCLAIVFGVAYGLLWGPTFLYLVFSVMDYFRKAKAPEETSVESDEHNS